MPVPMKMPATLSYPLGRPKLVLAVEARLHVVAQRDVECRTALEMRLARG